jgi:hypothetical protein
LPDPGGCAQVGQEETSAHTPPVPLLLQVLLFKLSQPHFRLPLQLELEEQLSTGQSSSMDIVLECDLQDPPLLHDFQ